MDQTVFLWLMGCSHWASKPNQNHILAICIQRDFFGNIDCNKALILTQHLLLIKMPQF
ncbi:DUF4291 family protein [Acinetobacter bereziniae]|uniref:DUF4291 family protein n=1 Tax=Acinetobacter bereziniae TaxID=106648 RepID=UPI000B169132|nr:DUF4291 family protein [Acinetobacter bereziniae]